MGNPLRTFQVRTEFGSVGCAGGRWNSEAAEFDNGREEAAAVVEGWKMDRVCSRAAGGSRRYSTGQLGWRDAHQSDRNSSRRPQSTWSPDGRQLAFTETTGKRTRIVTADIESQSIVTLAEIPASDLQWSPDGKTIVFVSDPLLPMTIGATTKTSSLFRSEAERLDCSRPGHRVSGKPVHRGHGLASDCVFIRQSGQKQQIFCVDPQTVRMKTQSDASPVTTWTVFRKTGARA